MLLELDEGEGGDEWLTCGPHMSHVTEVEGDVLRDGQRQRGMVEPAPHWIKQPCSCSGAKSE